MAGISNKSAGKLENRYKFNSATELNSDFDINLYETAFRGYDPQLGRFHQIDPLASSYASESPYSFAFNNPVNFNDPLGLDPDKPPHFDNAEGLLDHIAQNGLAGFGEGFSSYRFGDNGEMTGYYYTLSPAFTTNSHGDIGMYVQYGYSLDNGNSQGFRSAVMDEIVVGRQFVNLDIISSAKNNNSSSAVSIIASGFAGGFKENFTLDSYLGNLANAATLGIYGGMQLLTPVSKPTSTPNYKTKDYLYAAGYGLEKIGEALLFKRFGAIGASNVEAGGVNRIYSARELLRRTAEPGPFHNFPESFNQTIFAHGTKTITPNFFNVTKLGLNNTGIMYELPGTINGTNGVFQIGVRPSISGNTELIMHRFFKPY